MFVSTLSWMRSPAWKTVLAGTSVMLSPTFFRMLYFNPSAGPLDGAGAVEGRFSDTSTTSCLAGETGVGFAGLGSEVCGRGAGRVDVELAVCLGCARGAGVLLELCGRGTPGFGATAAE